MSLNGSTEGEIFRGYVAGSEELRGNISNPDVLSGKIAKPRAIHGKSAYEIAVMCGFDGTVEEWLESLKGEKPIKGTDYFTAEEVQAIIDDILSNLHQARIGYVTILADGWAGNDSPYSQVVDVQGVTENSQVDLTPSVEQLAVFHEKDLAFVTENEGGVVTVYAVGQKPENDYTIQVTITEVDV